MSSGSFKEIGLAREGGSDFLIGFFSGLTSLRLPRLVLWVDVLLLVESTIT